MRGMLLKMSGFGVLILCFTVMPGDVSGQDLGSGSGLFDKRTTPKKKPVRRSAPAKKKRTTSKKTSPTRTARKKSAPATTTERPVTKAPAQKPENDAATAETDDGTGALPSRTIIINVGDKTNGDFSELFERAIADGNRARNLRNYIEAENAYGRARTLDPKDSRAIYGLGNLYSDQQRWEEAEKAYRQAILIEPENPAAYIAISYVLTQPVVGSSLGERYQEAEKMARRAIELAPDNAIAYDQLGVSLELRGLIGAETRAAYEKAIELEPGFALAYAHLARLMRRNGRNAEAAEADRNAVRLATSVPTMILVAEVMQSQQRYAESEELLRSALRQDPKNPTGLYLLGRVLTVRRSFDEAESVLLKSVEVSPNSFVSYTLLGSVYYTDGKLEQAEEVLGRALKVISENERKRLAQEFEEVGDRYVKLKRYEDAGRVYRRAKELDAQKESLTNKLSMLRKN